MHAHFALVMTLGPSGKHSAPCAWPRRLQVFIYSCLSPPSLSAHTGQTVFMSQAAFPGGERAPVEVSLEGCEVYSWCVNSRPWSSPSRVVALQIRGHACQGEGDWSTADWFQATVTEGRGFTPLFALCMLLPSAHWYAAVRSWAGGGRQR